LDEKKKTTYDFSSVQVNLPSDIAQNIIQWGKDIIPDEELYSVETDERFGRENEIHITVLYGLHDPRPDPIEKLLKNETPINIKIGKISKFTTNKNYDVIKLDIHSKDLVKLNKLLRENCNYTSNFPIYKPHCTIAYVKKDFGKTIKRENPFQGKSITFNEIVFSSNLGNKFKIKLKIND